VIAEIDDGNFPLSQKSFKKAKLKKERERIVLPRAVARSLEHSSAARLLLPLRASPRLSLCDGARTESRRSQKESAFER
jgi:hypothetical protein